MPSTFSLLALLMGVHSVSACMGGTFIDGTDYFSEKTEVAYSGGFTIVYKNFYKEVTTGGQKYLLVQCFSDAAENAKAVAALPACSLSDAMPCHVLPIPVKIVSLAGAHKVVGMLEELNVVSSVNYTSNFAVAPCLQKKEEDSYIARTDLESASQMDTTDVVFMSKGFSTTTHNKIVDLSAFDDEAMPLGRAEWVEFVALFFNKEGWANYLVERISLTYTEQTTMAKALFKVGAVWIESITSDRITFTSSQFIKNLMADANINLLDFGGSVDLTNVDERNFYIDNLKTVSVVYLATGVRHTDLRAVLESIKIVYGSTQFVVHHDSKPYNVFQPDLYVSPSHTDSSEWEEESASSPDLLLSDIMKSSRVDNTPWTNTEYLFMRHVSSAPVQVRVSAFNEANMCERGLRRPSDVLGMRHYVQAGLSKASANPTGPVTHQDHYDFFPDKADQEYAVDFEIFYHLTWKLVRNYLRKEDYILILDGTSAASHPSAYVLPAAKKIVIPVTTAAVAATPTVHIMVMLGVSHTIVNTTYSPHPCIMKAIENGTMTMLPWSPGALNTGVYFANYADSTRSNSVATSATSDPGHINRAEWVNFVATFFNKEKLAEEIFRSITGRYLCVEDKGYGAVQTSGNRPRVMVLSYSRATTTAAAYYQISNSSYMNEWIHKAGGIHVSVDPTSLAYIHGEPAVTYGNPIIKIANLTLLKTVFADVDVFIDQYYHFGKSAAVMVTLDDFKAAYEITVAEEESIAFYKNQKIYRIDNGTDDTMARTDQFTRMVVEPDAGLEDMISILHPGWDGSITTSYFFRNLFDNTPTRIYSASQCTGTDSPDLLSRDITCSVPCSSRNLQEYCNLECTWDLSSSSCSESTPLPPFFHDTEVCCLSLSLSSWVPK